jgi:tRNA dimethylallyltransferase
MNIDHVKPKIIVICGPTGIGKTTMAIRVAEAFTGEIVGADSMQIYRYMDIGTAKPTPDETSRITHHMIDVADPSDFFDAARYVRMARPCVQKLIQNNVLPVVAGGTGLYIKALLHGLSKAAMTDPVVKNRLKKEAETCGSHFLHERLTDCDPIAARRIHPNDSFRIIRALEVFEMTGRPMSSVQAAHQFDDNPFDALNIGLFMDRTALYARIDQRVETMITAGLIDEVQGLLDSGYDPKAKAMQSIGYRHVIAYLAGQIDKNEAIRTLKRDTRRYAKRQQTWFKADRDMIWMAPDDWDAIHGRVRSFLGGLNDVAVNHS